MPSCKNCVPVPGAMASLLAWPQNSIVVDGQKEGFQWQSLGTRCALFGGWWWWPSRPWRICDAHVTSFELTALVTDSLECHIIRAENGENLPMNFDSRKPIGKQERNHRTSTTDHSFNDSAILKNVVALCGSCSEPPCEPLPAWFMLPRSLFTPNEEMSEINSWK
jgi:hypothetical protein